MAEKETKGYIAKKVEEIEKETGCEDCILFIGKGMIGKESAKIRNEGALVAHIRSTIRAYGKLGEDPLRRQVRLLGALTQVLIKEIQEGDHKTVSSFEIYDILLKEEEDDPSVEN